MVRFTAARLRLGARMKMQSMKRFAAELWADASGQDLVEYALVAVCMALAGVALLSGLEASLANTFNHFGTVLTGSV